MNTTNLSFSSFLGDFHLENLQDKTISLIKWDPLKRWILVIILLVFLVLGVVSRLAIINYIKNYAPDKRPINYSILCDQVCTTITYG